MSLTVTLARRDEHSVCLSITDSGGGMDADNFEHLFEPFYTTKGELVSGAGRNAGMGLAVVHGLINEMQGTITASNVRNLVLNAEVTAAVEAGRFHVYAINSIEEGIELLTGVPAGEADDSGVYPEGSINARVVARLEEMGTMLRSPDLVGARSREDASQATPGEDQGRERDPREGPGQPPVAPVP